MIRYAEDDPSIREQGIRVLGNGQQLQNFAAMDHYEWSILRKKEKSGALLLWEGAGKGVVLYRNVR